MKILSSNQIKELDGFTILHEPVSSIDLMERASSLFVKWFIQNIDNTKKIKIFCGPGNNGGDGLAVGRMLLEKSFQVEVYIFESENYSNDFIENRSRLEKTLKPSLIKNKSEIPVLAKNEIIIDAIFGSGLNRAVAGLFADTIKAINAIGSTIIAIDIASGLFCDSHTPPTNPIIQANFTISFQLPKLAFLLPENFQYVGEWRVLNIGLSEKFISSASSSTFFTTSSSISGWVKKRSKFSHKGTYGRSLIIGGSYGMIGAVILASKACLRTGSGLCRSYVPKCGYEIMQTSFPESITVCDPDFESITQIPDITSYNSIGIGPGISENEVTAKALLKLFNESKVPLVIDAGALNIISLDKSLLTFIPENSILTPHPKEFERLAGPVTNDFQRLKSLSELSQKFKFFIVLKGHYTVIACPNGELHFNSTGNPGMATAGSGDVLTGIITGLLSQGYEPYRAAILGVFMHGYAGDAASEKLSQSSLIASDIIEGIHSFYKTFS